MHIYYLATLWQLFVFMSYGHAQGLGKSQPNSYYYLKQNGGYEYAFNTETGMQSSQTADQSNEVTGHYMYYDKGVPFMVKYRAGVHGYQPEIIPPEKLLSGNYHLPSFKAQDTGRDLRTSNLLEPVQNNYRLTQTQQLAPPKVSSFSIGTDTTLKFVQDALQTMQTQPMHLSFNAGVGQVQHPPGPFATTTVRPQTAPLPQPITRTEVQDINNLAPLEDHIAEVKQPYSFNYNGDQSSRTETADQSGNVIGSYSYYDEAGYHDVSYKAGDETGFVILGRNSQNQRQAGPHATSRQYFRHPNSLETYNLNSYSLLPDARLSTNSLDERNLGKRSPRSSGGGGGGAERYMGKRSLRKFRRYSKW